jgi:hypothetical protein
MNTVFKRIFFVAAILSAPAAFAQTSQGLTRAEVRADLVRVEQAGYRPGNGGEAYYPAAIQAAEAKISAQQNGATQSAAATPKSLTHSATMAHAPSTSNCVGPASFCNTYFAG